MNLYVGNLSPAVEATELQQMFAGVGQVLYAKLSESGEATSGTPGYAFVNVPNADQARSALTNLNGKLVKGEKITVCAMDERPGIVGSNRK